MASGAPDVKIVWKKADKHLNSGFVFSRDARHTEVLVQEIRSHMQETKPPRQARADDTSKTARLMGAVRLLRMRLALKIGLGLSLTHGMVFLAAAERGSGIMSDIYFASIYLPLILFGYVGLPVSDGFTGWGWSGPSGFGCILAILFWIGVWFLFGRIMERILKGKTNA